MAWVEVEVRALAKIAALGALASCVALACATGGSRVDVGDDSNITETVSTTSGVGGQGGATTAGGFGGTPTMGGNGGEGGELPPCDEDPCRVMTPQCGCPVDQKCSLINYMRTCRAAGPGLHGETCTGDGDCAAGTFCLNIGGHRVCRDYCETNSDCLAPGGQCVIELGLNPGTEKWCSDNCDPVSNSGCTVGGSKCELLQQTSTTTWYTQCVAAGPGTQGAACSAIDDCAVGFGCLTVNAVSSCHQYCDVNAPVCPGSAPTCAQFETPVLIGAKEYGGCL